jgi:hypothetical protein
LEKKLNKFKKKKKTLNEHNSSNNQSQSQNISDIFLQLLGNNINLNDEYNHNLLNFSLNDEFESLENINQNLLNNCILKYKSLLNNVINNETFCEFIKNKDDINLISFNASNLTNLEYKYSAIQINNMINLLSILSNKIFYVIIYPTINEYKVKYNCQNSSIIDVITNIFNKLDEWIIEYNQSNIPINLSNENENENENLNLPNSLLNIFNTFLTNMSNNNIPDTDNIINVEEEDNNEEEDDDEEDDDEEGEIEISSNDQILNEKIDQMKELGLTNINKCKFCLTLSNGDVEMAINYYYEINIDFV